MINCPKCNEENPPKFRLCGYCGAPLTAAPPALPAHEVRRTVTLIFCDLKGSTELAEVRATSLPTLVQMVAGGLGITLLPESAADVLVPTARGPVQLGPDRPPALRQPELLRRRRRDGWSTRRSRALGRPLLVLARVLPVARGQGGDQHEGRSEADQTGGRSAGRSGAHQAMVARGR